MSEYIQTPDVEQRFSQLNVVIVGLPGSGKSSLMDSLNPHPNYVSLGDISRAEMAKPMSHMAEVQKRLFENTKPWPADMVVQMIAPYLIATKDTGQGFVLDGVPRKASEAEALTNWACTNGVALDFLLHLQINPQKALERIAGRDNSERLETAAHYESRMQKYLSEEEAMLEIMRAKTRKTLTINTDNNPPGLAKKLLLDFVASNF